jgi:hypothetical protein
VEATMANEDTLRKRISSAIIGADGKKFLGIRCADGVVWFNFVAFIFITFMTVSS